MKLLTVFGTLFAVCFLFGFGLVVASPTSADAGIGGPSPCTNYCGYDIHCESDPSCDFGDAMHVRCRQWAPALADCDGPWTCGCRDIGCGPQCIIE